MMKQIVLLQTLATTGQTLATLFEGVELEMAQCVPANDSWCMNDVLSHLSFVEKRSIKRLKRLVNEEKPVIYAIHPDEVAHMNGTAPNAILSQFEAERGKMLRFLQGLSEEQWLCDGTFESGETSSVQALVQLLVSHDTQHMNQLVKIKEGL